MNPKILDIQGWMAESELEFLHSLVVDAGPDDLIVELGSWKGRSTAALYTAMHHNQTIVTIDTWLGQADLRFSAHVDVTRSDIFLEFMENMRIFKMEPTWYTPEKKGSCYLRMLSSDAKNLFPNNSIKRLILDSDHEEIGRDIDEWNPKLVKPGGIFCGHDWNWTGAKESITRRFDVDEVIDDIWIVRF